MSVALAVHRGLHNRPGGWLPNQLGTLSLWLDADDATTITISTGVSQWDDKSGNGRHVTQATGSRQPAWTKGAQNGRAALTFTGANIQNLSGGNILPLRTGGVSMMTVHAVGGSTRAIAGKVTNILSAGAGEWRLESTRAGYADATVGDVSFAASSSLQVHGMVVDRAVSVVAYRNGTSLGSATPTTSATDYNGSEWFFVGAQEGATPYRPATGDICEIVVSMATWTTDERQLVEGYLAHKWGTTASLPSDHPYKSVAP